MKGEGLKSEGLVGVSVVMTAPVTAVRTDGWAYRCRTSEWAKPVPVVNSVEAKRGACWMNGGRGLRGRQHVAEEASRPWKWLGGVEIMREVRSKTRARLATEFFGSPVLLRREMEKLNQGGVEGTAALGKCILFSVLRECRVPGTGEDLMYRDRGIERKCSLTFRDSPGRSAGAKRRKISQRVLSAIYR